ncbi:MAG TPA: TIGR03905 family TSCPD domain-containing protein [Candidatus Phocaeicola caecigallinarum]|nr:TIGR03905 family TSCPD domain-containing protein [Candidatus Phocaeicola caecigallinarum]
MRIDYQTQGTCSTHIEVEVEDGIVKDVRYTGGCNGNLQGISALVKGMPVSEVIARLEGIRCGSKPTSCPDQLCKALRTVKA